MDAISPPIRRAEDLLLGALAVLSLQGVTTLETTDRSFHHHFASALDAFREAGGEFEELADEYHQDLVSKTFEELDHALINAERFRFLSFPNPTYSRLRIKMTPRAARRILDEWKDGRQVFERAAQRLRQSIEY